MDNLCHTLVGAALAESGLKRRTSLGAATLMIGANFPDIDVALAFSEHGLAFRRGITHGVPALVVLPFVLAAIMLAWDRLRPRRQDALRAQPAQLLVLAAISIATHPVLDWMNTYGMRWFMPFSGRWRYGDALFIVDLWILAALGLGIFLSRRMARRQQAGAAKPARVAVAAVTAYIVLMLGVTAFARTLVRQELANRAVSFTALVVDPVPLNPFARRVIYESGGRYEVAVFQWRRPWLSAPFYAIQRNADEPLARRANETPRGRDFLSWSRLPFYDIERGADSSVVFIGDARYTRTARGSWASARVVVSGKGLPASGLPMRVAR